MQGPHQAAVKSTTTYRAQHQQCILPVTVVVSLPGRHSRKQRAHCFASGFGLGMPLLPIARAGDLDNPATNHALHKLTLMPKICVRRRFRRYLLAEQFPRRSPLHSKLVMPEFRSSHAANRRARKSSRGFSVKSWPAWPFARPFAAGLCGPDFRASQ